MNRFSCAALLAIALAACSGGNSASENASPPVPMAPGSSIENTPVATIGMTVLGEILPKGPSNFYRFDNPAKLRDQVTVRLENKSATLRPEIRVYNAHRAQLLNLYSGTAGASVEQGFSLDPGQTIYVEVTPSGSAGAYQLSVLAQKAYDANEPNDDQLTPTPLKSGTPTDGSIMDGKDADWFRLSGTRGGTVQVVLENQSATLKPHIKIYSATKSQLSEKYDGTPRSHLDFMFDVEPGKDIYVQVIPNGSIGRYRLMIRALR